MEYMKITEELSLSRIIQGFWRLTNWEWDTKTLEKFIKGCIDRGVTTLDTAEIYGFGECETQLGRVFQKNPALRHQIQLVSKTGIFNKDGLKYYDTSYERIKTSCKESLQRLCCDYLDLYLIHREDPCFSPQEVGKAMLELKKEGLVREIGVSNFDPFKFQALNEFTKNQLCTNQIEWNPCCFEHFDSGMMDMLTQKGIHPMIWSSLAGGKIFTSGDKPYVNVHKKLEEIGDRHGVEAEEIAYAWILYHPVKAMPIVGSSKLSRLDHAIKALDVKLERWEWYEIYTASGEKRLR
ncbi:aldo/keto reductase [Anaerotignum sp.]|uniref:aldo/keto reductase n=1 Tax=Anaerotignum sp. TaxID=2039241 RepID=UPI00331F79CC